MLFVFEAFVCCCLIVLLFSHCFCCLLSVLCLFLCLCFCDFVIVMSTFAFSCLILHLCLVLNMLIHLFSHLTKLPVELHIIMHCFLLKMWQAGKHSELGFTPWASVLPRHQLYCQIPQMPFPGRRSRPKACRQHPPKQKTVTRWMGRSHQWRGLQRISFILVQNIGKSFVVNSLAIRPCIAFA